MCKLVQTEKLQLHFRVLFRIQPARCLQGREIGRKVWNVMVLNKTAVSERSPLGVQAEEMQELQNCETSLTVKGNPSIVEVENSFGFVFLVRCSDV